MQVGIRDVLEGNLVWTVEVVLCSMAASSSSARGLHLGERSRTSGDVAVSEESTPMHETEGVVAETTACRLAIRQAFLLPV